MPDAQVESLAAPSLHRVVLEEIYERGFYPFVLVRSGGHAEGAGRFLSCKTQNEADRFARELASCPRFAESKLVRGIERALSIRIAEAADLLFSWTRAPFGGRGEAVGILKPDGGLVHALYNYPVFAFDCDPVPRGSERRIEGLREAFETYLGNDGNDLLRFAIIEALGLALARAFSARDQYTEALAVIDRALGIALASTYLRAAQFSVIRKRDGKNVPRYLEALAAHRPSQPQHAQDIATPFTSLEACGGIEDIELDIRWDGEALEREVCRRAFALSGRGIGRGAMVAVAHNGTARFFADLLAIWRMGATAACLDATLTPPEFLTVIRFARPELLLVDDDLPGHGEIGVPVANLSKSPFGYVPFPRVNADDTALVLFTSGTTGAPKGVELSFRALWARISANVAVIGRETLQRTLVTLPTHFGHGLIGNALTPLAAGGTIILPRTGVALAQNLGHLIDSRRVTFLSSVPALWRMATREPPPSGGTLLRVHIGSAPLSTGLWSEVAAWSRAEVVNCYGLTETANWVAGASSRDDGIGNGLIGRPWGARVAIKDEVGTIRGVGEGEILVASPALMSGYLDRPDLTDAVLRDGWFHTGDRGRLDAQGRIWLTGRLKDEINRAGFKIQPAEIDSLLETHPAIAEACVFGVGDPTSGEVVAAAVRPRSGVEIDQHELRDWCLGQLRREAVPERWFVVDAIPRNARGKVSRDAVRRSLLPTPVGGALTAKRVQEKSSADGDAPRQVIPAIITAAVRSGWVEAFGESALAADQPWDQTAGDSLDALRLLFSIEAELGVQLSFDVLEAGARPAEVASAIEKFITSVDAVTNEVSAAPLVFFFPPLEGDMPHIARFRAMFDCKFRFAMVHYPTSREIRAGFDSMEAFARFAVAQIQTSRESGPLIFFGCSSGGFVAWEAARSLVESGDGVAFFGLIDSRLHPEPFAAGEMENDPLRLTHRLRRDVLARFEPAPLDIQATLFRTDPLGEGGLWLGPADYGWGAVCQELTISNVEGSHATIFELSNARSLRQRMIEAVEAVVH